MRKILFQLRHFELPSADCENFCAGLELQPLIFISPSAEVPLVSIFPDIDFSIIGTCMSLQTSNRRFRESNPVPLGHEMDAPIDETKYMK